MFSRFKIKGVYFHRSSDASLPELPRWAHYVFKDLNPFRQMNLVILARIQCGLELDFVLIYAQKHFLFEKIRENYYVVKLR